MSRTYRKNPQTGERYEESRQMHRKHRTGDFKRKTKVDYTGELDEPEIQDYRGSVYKEPKYLCEINDEDYGV